MRAQEVVVDLALFLHCPGIFVATIKPTVAQTMVNLGLDLTCLTTCANLREGLRLCIRRMAEQDRV